MRTWIVSALLLCPTLLLANPGDGKTGDGKKEGSIRVTPVEGEAAEAQGISQADGSQHTVKARRLQPGEVLFHLRDADLATEVLPLLEQQAGIKLRLQAESRPVTLRLVQPVHWSTALELLCEFADVHVTKNHYGQIVMRDQFGGELGSREDWSDVQATLSDEASLALSQRERDAAARRAKLYPKIKARQAMLNEQARFKGTTATGGFAWNGSVSRGVSVRGTYSRGQYARGTRQTGFNQRGRYSRGRYSRGQYSRGRTRIGGNIQRGQYSRGTYAKGQYNRPIQRTEGRYSRGIYPRGGSARSQN